MYVKQETMVADTGEKIAVVDVDIDEFVSVCNSLRGAGTLDAATGTVMADRAVRSLVDAGIIPLIRRGTITQPIFDKYKVEDDYMTVVLDSVENLMHAMGMSFEPN